MQCVKQFSMIIMKNLKVCSHIKQFLKVLKDKIFFRRLKWRKIKLIYSRNPNSDILKFTLICQNFLKYLDVYSLLFLTSYIEFTKYLSSAYMEIIMLVL